MEIMDWLELTVLNFLSEILVSRQLQSKRKLTTELDKYKKRLESMQREIWALNAPLPVGGPERLQDEIERLRTTCKQMAMAVEEAGEFGRWTGIEYKPNKDQLRTLTRKSLGRVKNLLELDLEQ